MKILEVYVTKCVQCTNQKNGLCYMWHGGRKIDDINTIPSWCFLPDATQDNAGAESDRHVADAG